MGMWTAITIIVVACVLGEALRKRWESKHDSESAETIASLEARIEQLDADLRTRVETLERIVTDRKEDLRREFDYLDKVS